MAQDGTTAGGSSYTIDNVTFPVGRSKLQSIFDAIRSTNIGNTAPDLVAGQFWIDNNTPSTTVWTLYLYDGTDNISFATIDTVNNTVNFLDSTFDLINDTTPQLGAGLDLNSNDITGTGNINITGSLTATGNLTSLGIDDNATSTAITIDSSENVGIGATTPLHKLEVKDGEFAVRQTNSSSSPNVKLINDVGIQVYLRGAGTTRTNPGATQGMPQLVSLSGYDLFIGADGNDNIPFTTNRSERMRLTSDGKLSIGTSSPSAKLQVTTASSGVTPNANADELFIENNGAAGITIGSSTNEKGNIFFADSGNALDGYIQYAHDTRYLRFATAGLERLRINSSGNVGIGTTSPSSPLHTYVASGNAYNQFEGSLGRWVFGQIGSTYCQVGGLYGSHSGIAIDTSGNVGIGTTSPTTKLDIVGTGVNGIELGQQSDNTANSSRLFFNNSTNIWTAYSTTGNFKIASGATIGTTSGTDRLVINSSGNVGIGTSSPQHALDVTSSASVPVRIRSTASSNMSVEIDAPTGYNATILFKENDTNAFYIGHNASDSALFFWDGTANTERMRINSSGQTLIGTTVAPTNADTKLMVHTPISSSSRNVIEMSHNTNGANKAGAALGLAIDNGGESTNAATLTFRTASGGSLSERMRINSSGNVGINTTSPQEKLHIETPTGSASETGLRIRNGTSATDVMAQIKLQGGYASTSNEATAIISGGRDGTGNGSKITFSTGTTSQSERMRIDSSGNLLIGTTTTSGIESGTTAGIYNAFQGTILASRSGAHVLNLNRLTSDGDIARFKKDGTTVGSIGTNNSLLTIGSGDTGLKFSSGVDSIFPFDVSTNANRDNAVDVGYSTSRFKDLYLSGGAFLGGTGTANKLDDYEEGTFTPTISVGITSPTYSVQIGEYTKIGNVCKFKLRVAISSGTGNASRIQVSGLPFTSLDGTGDGVVMSYASASVVNSTTRNLPTMYIGTNQTSIQFYDTDGSDFVGNDLNSPSSANFYIAGTYLTT